MAGQLLLEGIVGILDAWVVINITMVHLIQKSKQQLHGIPQHDPNEAVPQMRVK